MQVHILIWIQQLEHAWLDVWMILSSFFGNTNFYIFAIPIVYWFFGKRLGIRVATLVIASISMNEALKVWFQVIRPIGHPGIRSLYIQSAPGYSFPSGHSQSAITFWGYLATRFRNIWFTILAGAIIVTITFSRLYLGVHWPLDVLAGLLLGAAVIWLGLRMEDFFREKRLTSFARIFSAGVLSVFIFFIYPKAEGIELSGYLFGMLIGYMIEEKMLTCTVPSFILDRLGVLIVGSGVLAALREIFMLLIPPENLYYWLAYSVLGLYISWMAPWLFVKLGFYRRKGC
ncbi:phosphatase PAP2 family protein [Fodinisporobacter ferrooxydans]|uniref:Phosphatase PAP2 family protein n=1 Tax=Fodinisporobacter ferrooxydans TaxID=2901836 RepID=A0ABY4CPL4_9BACL|nr:phosphatase PAP2 family protein [Alicyclobacillaceae bacterium MYW30-H2]